MREFYINTIRPWNDSPDSVTYLVCHSEQRFNHYEGLHGFNADWDRPKRPSECVWFVPGTEG